ncbi:MAG: hypothetical protein UT24_C0001G0049 [Candidatus Woesebacteria bacterium GW2011_GWB1_39_12]|uniref:Uncharacterized protein n=2 Tax=Candidatus Woeseibacteriota TaxID=1752722 RepID=A0A0G0M3K4_9BACT|nr:MAG: hypothetical protein UT23_C0001G0049 [Candidatus Woesebacteria bacterium GW2011_GWA1_39_12]KKR01889.1 MAG: hypothetical protein UT24_C0001G0049 [Candidatus Woesebacteria bacterium GW2011_GWB1_39_12]
MSDNQNNRNVTLHNREKLGTFDGLPVEPIRTEVCVQNLASCLGVTVPILKKLGILKSSEEERDGRQRERY